MKSLAFIDNFIETPVIHGVNDYINHSNLPCTYHMPAKFGMGSLNSLKKYDGLVILGSASHITENLPWHRELIDFIIPKLETGTPVLGICFGHQLLASHYGCEVGNATADGHCFKEAREIEITEDTMGYTKGQLLTLGHSHSQIVKSISPQLKSFAKSKSFPNEALTHRKYPMWSFQAHPEASNNFLINDAGIKDDSIIQKIMFDGFTLIDQFVSYL